MNATRKSIRNGVGQLMCAQRPDRTPILASFCVVNPQHIEGLFWNPAERAANEDHFFGPTVAA